MRYLRIASLGAIVVLGAACSDQRPMVDRLDGLETTVGEMSAQSTHTIETIVDAGQGSIDCGPPTVQAGDTVTCTITPAYQYLLDELQDNSENVIEAVGPDLKYVIENVQRSHTIRVRFANLPTLRFRAEPPARLRVWSWGGWLTFCDLAGCEIDWASPTNMFVEFYDAEQRLVVGEWTGLCSGQSNPCAFHAFRSSEIVARLHYRIRVSPSEGGVVSCPDSVPPGGTATCTVTPEPGFVLVSLVDVGREIIGDVDVTDEVVNGQFELADVQWAPSLVATFGQARTVVVTKDEEIDGLVTSQPAGIACGAGCASQEVEVVDGDLIELTATSGPGVEFMGWSGDVCEGAANPCVFSADQDVNVQAHFGYAIQTSVNDSSGGSLDCESPVLPGASSTCTLSFAESWGFTDLLDNGASVRDEVSLDFQYVVENVREPHTIRAELGYSLILEMYGTTVSMQGSPAVDVRRQDQAFGTRCFGRCFFRSPPGFEWTLTAVEPGGIVFAGWTGTCEGQSNPCKFRAWSEDQVNTPIFHYGIRATAQGGGTISCPDSVLPGGTVSCELIPDPGSTLVALTDMGEDVFGDVVGGTYTLSDVQEYHVLEATFARSLAVSKAEGIDATISSQPAGISCGPGCGHQVGAFAPETRVELTASPGPGVEFIEWWGACRGAANPCAVTVDGNTEVWATFGYQVRATSTEGGSIHCESPVLPGAPSFCAIGIQPGYVLLSLMDNGVETKDSVREGFYPLDAVGEPHEIHAIFGRRTTLTVSKNDRIHGSVTIDPMGVTCGSGCQAETLEVLHGAVVELKATPGPEREFIGWSGDVCADEGNPCVFQVDAVAQPNPSVEARFGHPIHVSVPGGNGAVVCDGPVPTGESATCTITPDPGFVVASLRHNGLSKLSMLEDGVYLIEDVQEPHVIEVSFGHPIVGSITGVPYELPILCSRTLPGMTGRCEMLIPTDFRIVSVLDNGEEVLERLQRYNSEVWLYSIPNVREAHTVEVFLEIFPRITVEKRRGLDATVTSNPAGISCGPNCGSMRSQFPLDTVVELTATPGPGVVFMGWTGDCDLDEPVCRVLAEDHDHQVEAHFGFLVTASSTGGGSISCTGPVSPEGESFCLVAADPGYALVGLRDGDVDVLGEVSGGVYRVRNVMAPREVHAVFDALRTPLTVSKVEAIDGMVTSEPAGIACGAGCASQVLDVPHGSMVELLATAGPGVEFMGWGGGVCAGAANPCAFPVDVVAHPNPSVQAHFGHSILASVPGGNGALDCEGPVALGGSATCTIAPAAGYGLAALLDNGVDVTGAVVDGRYSIADVHEAHELVASFSALPKVTITKHAAIEGTVASEPAGLACGPGCDTQTASFVEGVQVELTATAGPGVVFMGWEGELCPGSAGPCVFTATQDVQIGAKFGFEIVGRVMGAPSSREPLPTIACTSPVAPGEEGSCSIRVPETHRLVSVLDNGMETIDRLTLVEPEVWSYAISPVEGAHTVEVVVSPMHRVEVAKRPEIDATVTSDPAGISCGRGCGQESARFAEGTAVELVATPGPGVAFLGWTGACHLQEEPQCTVDAYQDHEVQAQFGFLVSGTSTQGGSISCESPVAPGASTFCTLSAEPGHVLVGLTDNGADVLGEVSGGVYTLRKVEEPHELHAVFSAERSLTITKVAGIESRVTVEPGGLSCGLGCASRSETFVDGTVVRLTASPSADMLFVGWTGACADEGNPCELTLAADGTVGATFAYPIEVVATAGGQVDCPAHVEPGASAVCTLTPDAGYVLATVTDNGQSVILVDGQYFIQDATGPHAIDVVFKQDRGTACTADAECGSGLCVDGFCCNAACEGQCEACDVAGSEGLCVAVSGAPHGDRAACDTDGSSCGGFCDGATRDACTYPTTECTPASCTDGVATLAASCSGDGSCPAVVQVDCAPYACGVESCLDSCTNDGDCVASHFCALDTATCEPNVSISVSGPPAANEGMEIAYTYVVENRAPTASEPLAVALPIPEGTRFVSLEAPAFDCEVPASGSIACAHDGLPGASSETIVLHVEIDEPASVAVIENEGYSVREAAYESQPGSPLLTQVTTDGRYADLGVWVSSEAAQAAWGSPATFVVVVENAGPHDVEGAKVQALLPALADRATWSCASDGGHCRNSAGLDGIDTRVDLPVGFSATFVVEAWATKGLGADALTLAARVFAPEDVLDGYPANDHGAASVALTEGSLLLVEKDPIGVVVVEPEHLVCGEGCGEASGAFLEGTMVTATAEAPAGVVFIGWEGACTGAIPSCTFPMHGNVELVAHFGFAITTSVTEGGSIDCPAHVVQGGSATCELHADAGYVAHALTDNGADAVLSGTSYTIADAQGRHEIHAIFKQDLGTACSADAECGSGICVDGFCCDAACDGQCEACDLLGSEGVCSPVSGAPRGDRPACAADGSSCGGFCDGTNPQACAYPGGETSCRAPSCEDGVGTLPASCAGDGSCPALVTVDCGPYVCGADACLTSCGGDFDCAAGNYCMDGACVPVVANGTGCQADNECASGLCVDGFCCDAACEGQCEACDVEGFEGVCTAVLGAPHGDRAACDSDGTVCGGFCDGELREACAYPGGDTLCGAPSCADGVAVLPAYCDGAGACPEPEEQPCAPYVCGADACLGDCASDLDCADGQYCSAGICVDEKENGESCSADNQCGSGLCVDGFCCNAACDGQCEACDVAGMEGSCVPVNGAPHGDRAACDSDGSLCGGFCDGTVRDACSYPGAETVCGAASCEDGLATPEALCQGDGSCAAVEEVSCGHYACGEDACLDSCASDADCADSAYCHQGSCRSRGDLSPWKVGGSGGCSTGGGGGLGLALLVVGFALAARRRKTAALGALAVCVGAGTAGAQEGVDRSFQVNRFQPSGGHHDLLGVQSARVAPHSQFGMTLFLNHAREPLRVVARDGGDLEEALIRHQTTLDLAATLGLFDRIELSAVLPVTLGQGIAQPSMLPAELAAAPSGGASDLRLIPKALLYDGVVRLGVALPVSLPTAPEDSFLGHGGPTAAVRGLVEWGRPGSLVLSGYVGNRFAEEREFGGLQVGSALQVGLAAAQPFSLSSERFQAILTATGERVWADGDGSSPFEVIGAVQWFAPLGLHVTVGGGPGLSDGYGSPSYRLLAGVGYTPVAKEEERCKACAPPPAPPPAVLPPADPDGDIEDEVDDADDAIAGGQVELAVSEEAPPLLPACERRAGTVTQLLEPIRFAFNSATILPESEPTLGELAALLRRHQEVITLSIEGHTDSTGDERFNIRLSERRAAAVLAWLVREGIEPARLTSAGHGPTRPVADNATPEGRERNRRVEFHVVKCVTP